MADDDYMRNYFGGLTGGGFGTTTVPNEWAYNAPEDWTAQPARVTVTRPVQAAPGPPSNYLPNYRQEPPPEPPPPPAPTGLGSWFSLLGGGQPAAPQPGTAPGWQQAAAGLGLGLLSGNPFNKWGAALEGYQRGAAADVARQQMTNQYSYQQQALKQTADLARERMGLERELAYKPQVQFRQNEEGEWEALQYDPKTGKVGNLPFEQADKIADQGAVVKTYRHPLTNEILPFPPGIAESPRARREFLRKLSDTEADIAAGKDTWWQWLQRTYYGAGGGRGQASPTIEPGKTIGERKQFKQGWGVWNGNAWVKERP